MLVEIYNAHSASPQLRAFKSVEVFCRHLNLLRIVTAIITCNILNTLKLLLLII